MQISDLYRLRPIFHTVPESDALDQLCFENNIDEAKEAMRLTYERAGLKEIRLERARSTGFDVFEFALERILWPIAGPTTH